MGYKGGPQAPYTHLISYFLTGSLTSRLISDTDKMGRSVAMNVNVLLRSLVKTCGMLYFMLGLSWQLTLLTCIEMPLLAFIQNSYNNIYQVSKPLETTVLQQCLCPGDDFVLLSPRKRPERFRTAMQRLRSWRLQLSGLWRRCAVVKGRIKSRGDTNRLWAESSRFWHERASTVMFTS